MSNIIEKTGIYFARKVNIYFPIISEKEKFDKWFEEHNFQNVPADTIIERIDDYIEDNGFDAVFGGDEGDEEDYIKSVYNYRFGENWQEEYENRWV